MMDLTVIKSVRTNNFNNEAIMEKISNMWKEASNVLENHNGLTYGLYYDYESDYKGDYTLTVAIEGNEKDATIQIPEKSTYKVFEVDTSDEYGILNTWKKIWELEENGDLNRAYTYDFEIYFPNGQVEIHIAIK